MVVGVALQAHFAGDLLLCEMRDPEVPDQARLNLRLERRRFTEGYYRPLRQWLPTAEGARIETVRGQGFLVADLPEVGLSVGLREDILKERKEPLAGRAPAENTVAADGDTYAGADGILVRAGRLWSGANMRLEPQARQGLAVTARGPEPTKE